MVSGTNLAHPANRSIHSSLKECQLPPPCYLSRLLFQPPRSTSDSPTSSLVLVFTPPSTSCIAFVGVPPHPLPPLLSPSPHPTPLAASSTQPLHRRVFVDRNSGASSGVGRTSVASISREQSSVFSRSHAPPPSNYARVFLVILGQDSGSVAREDGKQCIVPVTIDLAWHGLGRRFSNFPRSGLDHSPWSSGRECSARKRSVQLCLLLSRYHTHWMARTRATLSHIQEANPPSLILIRSCSTPFNNPWISPNRTPTLGARLGSRSVSPFLLTTP